MRNRSRLLTSGIAFTLAFLVMVTLHELAHAVAGKALGGSPVMYGFNVDQGGQTNPEAILTALAGPVFSLLSGVVVLALPTDRLPPVWRLVVLWLGLLSVQEFSGYLITGPFTHVGDIGSVLARSNVPAVVGWVGFLVGWALTYVLGRHATARFARLTTPHEPLAPQLRALGLFAWLAGVAAVMILSVGLLTAETVTAGEVVFEALGLLASGIFLIFVRFFLPLAQRQPRQGATFTIPMTALVVVVVAAVLRQLVLAGGLHL